MTPARVALVCADRGIPLLGCSGASAHLRALAAGYRALGCAVELWVARLGPAADRTTARLPPGLVAREGPRGRLPGVLRRDPARDRRVDGAAFARWVAHEALRFCPDLVHERHALEGPAAAGARGVGSRWLLEVNAPLAWEGALFRGQAPSRAVLRREEAALQEPDAVVAVSEPLLAWVRRVRSDASLLPNGADAPNVAPPPPWPPPGAPAAPFVLGHEGSHRPWHGFEGALPAVAAFAASLAPRRLLLACAGSVPAPALAALSARAASFDHALLGELDDAALDAARARWHAALSPRAPWPPPGADAVAAALGAPLPARWFAPLKEAAAAAAGLPLLADGALVPPAPPPPRWVEVAAAAWAAALPSTPARVHAPPWDDAGPP